MYIVQLSNWCRDLITLPVVSFCTVVKKKERRTETQRKREHPIETLSSNYDKKCVWYRSTNQWYMYILLKI